MVLIDTWWNVNIQCRNSPQQQQHVLIDTWWNVNINVEEPPEWLVAVLIDTWWNVNTMGTDYYPATGTGFNRYMVECESEKRRIY